MYFDSFSEFVAMGNHGLYVWLSYGIFLAVILWNVWLVRSTRKESLRLVRLSLKRQDAKDAESKMGDNT